MHPIRLEQIVVFDAGPLGLVDIAAELDVPLVSFWTAGAELLEGVCVVTDDDKREVRQRLSQTGVVADSIECFPLSKTPDVDGWRRAFDVGAYLGARSATVLNRELDDEAAADALAHFTSVAGEFGLSPNVEPISTCATRTLADASRIIGRSGASARITVDILHLMRVGGAPADLRALDPSLVGCAQICDGPATIAPERIFEESAFERLPPGDGSFPLAAFLAALPADVVLGVEVPMRSRRESGVSPRDRAAIAIERTRTVQLAADEHP